MASISRRINGTIFFLIGLMLLGRLLNIYTIDQTHGILRNVSEKMTVSAALQNLAILSQKLLMPPNDYLIHGHKEEITVFEALQKATDGTLRHAKNILRGSPLEEPLALFEKDLLEITRTAQEILRIDNPVGSAQGAVLMERMDALADQAASDIGDLVRTVAEDTAVSLRETQKNILVSRTINILLTILWITVGLSFSLLMSRSIVQSVRTLTAGMQKVSQGDFSHAIVIKSGDELQQMADTFNGMTTKVRESQDAIRNRSDLLDTANRELARKVQELKESEEKFYNISEMANDAIILIDFKGLVTFWNSAAERLFGYSRQEMIGKDLHAVIVPQRYTEAFRKGFEKFSETGQGNVIGETLEMEALRKDGGEFPIELSVSALRLENRWHALGILRDITDRRKGQAELAQRSRELEETNRELKEFMSAVTGRELLIIDLKREINELSKQLGKEPPHDLSFLDRIENKKS